MSGKLLKLCSLVYRQIISHTLSDRRSEAINESPISREAWYTGVRQRAFVQKRLQIVDRIVVLQMLLNINILFVLSDYTVSYIRLFLIVDHLTVRYQLSFGHDRRELVSICMELSTAPEAFCMKSRITSSLRRHEFYSYHTEFESLKSCSK